MGQAAYGVALLCVLGASGGTVRAQAAAAPTKTLPAPPPAAPIEAPPSDGSVQLTWQVPESSGCASEDEMRAQIERLSERSPLLPSGQAAQYTIAASIEPFETTWRARVSLYDATGLALGERELHGRSPTCRTLNVPIALVVVTLIDSLRPEGTVLAPPEAGPPRSPKPAVIQPQPKPPRRTPAPGPWLGLGVFGALAVGILPSPALGMGAALELRSPLPVALDFSAYLPVDELDARERGARFALFHAGAGVCPELIVAREAAPGGVRAQICALGELGAISAAGRGLTESSSATRLVAFVAIEPKLVWFVGENASLRASLVAAWVIERPRFTLDIEGQPQRAHQSDPAMLLLRIGFMGFAL